MIYLFHVPKGLEDDYEFDGEHANSCSICKYNGCTTCNTNNLGVYYDPPHNCDEKDICEQYYNLYVKPIKPLESKWNLNNKV